MLASVPVHIDVDIGAVARGIFKIEGTLGYADRAVTFDYRTGGVTSRESEVETLRLSLDALRDVELKRRVVGAAIILRPRRLDTLEDVPGAARDRLVFKVKRPHRAEAAALVAHLRRLLSNVDAEAASSIPFELPDVGLREISGGVYLDPEYLVFEVQDALIGAFDKEQQVIKVEPKALAEIRLEHGVFKDRLCVRPKKRELLTLMPGTYEEELKLKIWKRYREEAARLVEEVQRRRNK